MLEGFVFIPAVASLAACFVLTVAMGFG